MDIKSGLKSLLKILITIAVLECVYLFVLPPVINHFLNKDYIKNLVKENTNAKLDYSKAKIKTHLLPDITIKADTLNLSDKTTEEPFVNINNLDAKFSIFPLLKNKLKIKHIYADYSEIFLNKNADGTFNFERLFPSKGNKKLKLKLKKTKLKIKKYSINLSNDNYDNSVKIDGAPLLAEIKNKKYISILTQGDINDKISGTSNFDINLKTKLPFNYKKFDKNSITGNCTVYNVDMNLIEPVIQKYTDNTIRKFSGYIDYLQISADSEKSEGSQISVNTKFKDLEFDLDGWENHIIANGENDVNASLELINKLIKINSFSYKADKVNVKSNGNIELKKKPVLDLNIEVKDSKTENIAAILPPNLVPEYRTIEKIKKYGLYGDMEGKVNIKGEVPHPDITGYAKGRNLHILDEPMHKLHTGTVDLTFNKHILNMDILVDMFNNQKATVKGHTYMYRDGINDVTIKTTDKVDFPLAQKIVLPISDVFNFMLGPIPEMDITSGKGIIDMNIRGSMEMIDMNGYTKFDNAALTYNGLFAKMYNGKGRVDFKEDVISVIADRVYVKNNLVKIDGKVKLNDYLDFDILTNKAEGKDILELVNKSTLLKDVKEGLAIITSAQGPLDLKVNIKANIVPVPFGQPPLPPEEAFKDIRVKGNADVYGASCNVIGFDTPIDNIKGNVDFTETTTNINNIQGIVGKSPINITGKVINDIKTRTPEVDMEITSDAVYFGDTVRFLSESYMYPKNYPDISVLYNINSQHDLYFKYKAKSKEFVTNKAYAVMNFIKDDSDGVLKAKNGRIELKNSNVEVDNVNADLLGSNLNIDGRVLKVDTKNPKYNLDIDTERFDLSNINNAQKYNLISDEAKNVLAQFKDYKGFADVEVVLKNNVLKGNVNMLQPSFTHIKTSIPFEFDDFTINFDGGNVKINDVGATIASIPFFGDFAFSNIYSNPTTDSFFTSKITNDFIKTYLPKEIADEIEIKGDINLSSSVKGDINNLNLEPKITFFPDSDAIIMGTNIGDTVETREFTGNINLNKNIINIKKLDYIKYITSQNNSTYPVLFATGGGIFEFDKEKNTIAPKELTIKTEKNLSARILNIFLKNPIFKQGTFNCNLKYLLNEANKTAKLIGTMSSRNLDIPLFDTSLRDIKVDASEDGININLFGFMNDSRIMLKTNFYNNLYTTPAIKSLNISADELDIAKFMTSVNNANKAMKTNNEIKNTDFSNLHIENGSLDIKKLIIKSLVAENVNGKFSLNQEGLISADDINLKVGEGEIKGKLKYNLNSTDLSGDFALTNVDSNYVAETLFDGKNQIYGNANGDIMLYTKGSTNEEIIKNLSGFVFFEIVDGRMPKLGSLEYLLRAGNVIKSGITGFTLNSILELLNLVKTGYFSNIRGDCIIEDGVAKNIEIFSKGENMSLYIHGTYDISNTTADMEVLGKLSKRISTIFGKLGNTSLNTFFRLIPGISLLDFGRKDFIEDVEKIPSFTGGDYEARIFQAIIHGDINESGYVQSFKWVK